MKYEIDKLSFEFEVLDNIKPDNITQKPEVGVYVYGLYMEGARWNYNSHMLDESVPKELFINFPVIHLKPKFEKVQKTKGNYECPLYKVLSRAGTLLTTGQSTNFVLAIDVPSDCPQNKWIKAGVAMFLSLKQ